VEFIDVTDLTPKFNLAVLHEIGGNYNLSERLIMTFSFAFQQSFTTHSYCGNIKHDGMILTAGLNMHLRKSDLVKYLVYSFCSSILSSKQ
jgi:long-subunit fatty acid transport protein